MITISNFKVIYSNTNIVQNGVDVQNGYVYDICLNILDSFTYNYLYSSFNSTSFNSSNFKNYFNNVTTGYYINVTQDQINQFVNCSVRDSVIYSDLGYSPLSVT
jgi:hypothetical protein